jgi:hypothetical protein
MDVLNNSCIRDDATHAINRLRLTHIFPLPYKTRDSVLQGKPVKIRRGPATVSGEGRNGKATGACRWEGSFAPLIRKPGDRQGSPRFESTSKAGR